MANLFGLFDALQKTIVSACLFFTNQKQASGLTEIVKLGIKLVASIVY